jgi:hypothetical protein
MEIIDLRKYSHNRLVPLSKYGNMLVIREEIEFTDYPFTDPGILNYYLYNIDTQKIKKVDREKSKIIVDAFHKKEVEGADTGYYVAMKKQLFENQYFLNKINIEDEKADIIFEFKMDNEYKDLNFEVLDSDHVLVFYRQQYDYDFENFDYAKEHYGYERGILYNISSGESYEIKDREFLRGFRSIFFKATIMNEKCVVFEENYLDTFVKEQIYMDYHMNKVSKKEKFFYKDSLKYSSIEKFLMEVKAEKESISFIDIESRAITGYEIFSGVDENNIYYRVGTFGDVESDALVILDKQNLSKKVIGLPSEYDDNDEIENIEYRCQLEEKYKSILQLKDLTNGTVKVREFINDNINYTYSCKLGAAKYFIEEKFLIISRNDKETSVIDTTNNSIKSFKRANKVFDSFLILY